tara:strand:- start:438 stop:1085 length:648 start_codon:yes stop_codon:yes gene_type:complete
MAPKGQLNKAIEQAVYKYGVPAEPILKKYFNEASVSYPPEKVTLISFKSDRNLQLWAKNERKPWKLIHTYPLTAFSGHLGPKLREHDKQIPEGIYKLVSFNPYSAHHLSMMLNYPNEFDKLKGILDGRKRLGDNIFLHGKNTSVGCLAIGNKAIDQLFILARRIGLNNIDVIIAPNDLRTQNAKTDKLAQPIWLPELYKEISRALQIFPVASKKT